MCPSASWRDASVRRSGAPSKAQTAVDEDRLSGNVGGVAGREKRRRRRDFVGLAKTVERHALALRLPDIAAQAKRKKACSKKNTTSPAGIGMSGRT
jgi:hypothetical protein